MSLVGLSLWLDIMELGFGVNWFWPGMLIMLLFCGVLSLMYCDHYMGSRCGLWFLMFIFLFIMSLLVSSYGLLSSLIFWEYLGIVSYLLILYYSNSVSLRAAWITMVLSRIGDIGFFFIASWFLYNYEAVGLIMNIFIFFIVSTKSAAYPFISWLLEAMRAPTPVSALVHSSTLVAAGVWFSLCYNYLIYDLFLFKFIMFISCILSIIITGLCSLGFVDLKKIVALSTSNNISWCLFYILFGEIWLGLIQLVSHGVLKCVLFIIVGDLMSSGGSSQNYLNIYIRKNIWELLSLFFVIFGLSGFPFIGLFFSKHVFLIMICYSPILYMLILLGVLLSFSYSFRLFLMCISGQNGFILSLDTNFYLSLFFMPVLLIWGNLINFNFFEFYSMSFIESFLILLVLLIGVLLGWYAHYNCFFMSYWFSLLGGLDLLFYFLGVISSRIVNTSLYSIFRWDYNFVFFLLVPFTFFYQILFFTGLGALGLFL
uniref:NADH:ubiquinone reductase (H(+)-translocating) n=1 Tax=Sphyranura euryceae TaxID=2996394 RepID=A0AA51YGT3_9PLAT|nr:NADH dehydrogenase subunit 5 [Sphyranura euryceae]WMV02081.1 NADH dehydrogenase subunit 5 [Sphyranura euryceae]